MSFFLSSSREKLATGYSARQRRAEMAIRAIGVPHYIPIDGIRAANQASATVARVGCLHLLVSYQTVVACNLPDGTSYATPRGFYSKTTDRSISRFVSPDCRFVSPDLFADMVKTNLGLTA